MRSGRARRLPEHLTPGIQSADKPTQRALKGVHGGGMEVGRSAAQFPGQEGAGVETKKVGVLLPNPNYWVR